MWLWLFAGVHNDASVMGGGGEGGRRAVDNGWEGDIRYCRLYGVKLDRN